MSYATATLFQNGTAASSCTTVTDPNWCYYMSSAECVTSSCSSNSCTLTCTVDVWFVAEPTTGTSTITGDWEVDILVMDTVSNTGSGTSGANSVECNPLYYFDISDDTIVYGTVAPGATSTETSTTIYNQGNWQIDMSLKGEDMTSTLYTIPVGQQKYSSSSQPNWDGTALSTGEAGYNLDLPKPTATTTDSYDDLYWMIKIPDVQETGTYTGTNTYTVIDSI